MLEAVRDVEALLEVAGEGEGEERPAVGGQLHGGGETALHDGEVAGGQVPVEVGHEADDLEAVVIRAEEGRVDAGPGDDDHAELGELPLGEREGVEHLAQ